MGRGLLESVYQECLKEELIHRKINFLSELKIPVIYKSKKLNIDFRCDFLIENCLVVELKAITQFNEIHEAQLLNYIKLLKVTKGDVINFNSKNIFYEVHKSYV